MFARYDVFPALCAVLAVEGARRGRWGRAWAWAVLGGMLKLFPFLLLPGFLVVERAQTGRWALRRVGAACVPIALVTIAQMVVAPGSILSPLSYEFRRGFELSSVQGSLSFLFDPLHAHWIDGFASVELSGPGHVVISVLVSGAVVAVLLSIWTLTGRGRLSVVACSLATLSVAVLADKSFAPQYLVWLAPLWAYWPMRRGWVVAAALTALIYPVLYAEAHMLGPSFYLPTAVAVVRNAVLVIATLAWLREQLRAHQEQSIASRGDLRPQRLPGTIGLPASPQ